VPWPPTELQLVVAGFAGLCFASIPFYIHFLRGALRDRKLLRDAAAGIPPRDGEWGAFTGTLAAQSSIRAPMNGEDVVGYRYAVYYRKPRRDDSSMYYQGTALVPSTLVTARGSYPLLCFPTFAIEADPLDAGAVQRFRTYASETPFPEPYQPGRTPPAWDRDDPSTHRFDTRLWNEEPGWDQAQLIQQSIRAGETVTVFGIHRAGRGIVADPDTVALPELHRGTPAEALKTPTERMRQGITALIFLPALGLAAVWAYVYFTRV
jgi:hypothetical protein